MRNASGQPLGGTTFKRVPLGAGGQLIKLSIANDGTKAVCADIHGAYIRKPADSQWTYLFTDSAIPVGVRSADHTRSGFPGATYNDSSGCWDCVIAPSDSSKVALIYDGQLLVSTNGGTSFTAAGVARSNFSSNGHDQKAWSGHNITYDPNNPSVILYGTNGHSVFYSTNGGTSFTDLVVTAGNTSPGSYASPHWTACDPTSTQTSGIRQTWFYSRYGFGIYRSTTGPGGPYTLIASSPTNVFSMYVDTFGVLWVTVASETGLVHKWTSGGGWTTLTLPSWMNGYGFAKVAVDPASSNRIMLCAGANYFLTRDGGTNWVTWTDNLLNSPPQQFTRQADLKYLDILPPQQNNVESNMMAFDPTTASRLWSAGWIDINYCDVPATGSQGTNPLVWYGTGKGIEEAVVHTCCVTPTGKAFAGCWDLGAYRIDDLSRGVNPQVCAYKTGDTTANGHRHPTMIQPCASIDYAMDNSNYVVFLEWGGWDSDRQAHPHIGVSTDGGATLVPFAVEPPNIPVGNGGGNVAVGASSNIVIVWNCNKLGVVTTNGGASWSTLSIPGMIDGDNGIDVTGNAGYFLNRIDLTHDKVGYFYLFVSGNSQTPNPYGIWRSPDGVTWTRINTAAPAALGSNFGFNHSTHMRAVPGQSGHLFMTNGNGGTSFTGSLVRSTDYGATFGSALTTNSGQAIINVSDIGFGKPATGKTYPTIFLWGSVNGTYGLYRSDDNLVTCVLQGSYPASSTAAPLQVVGDQSKYGRVYLATDGNGVIVGDYDFYLTAV